MTLQEHDMKAGMKKARMPCVCNEEPLSESNVRKILWRANVREAAEPDNIPAHALKTCANQLRHFFYHLTLTGECPYLLQDTHHHSSTQKNLQHPPALLHHVCSLGNRSFII